MKYIHLLRKSNHEISNYKEIIDAIEKKILLPIAYKELLLELKGDTGFLNEENNAFLITDYYNETWIVSGICFQDINSVQYSIKENREDKESWEFKNIDSLLMIGRTDGRQSIFIGVNEDNFGKIYFAPGDDDVTDFLPLDALDNIIVPTIEIAPDLDSFVGMLKSYEELAAQLN